MDRAKHRPCDLVAFEQFFDAFAHDRARERRPTEISIGLGRKLDL
jgi:hypothetical protein